MDRTLSIGAFSRQCGISISALRFYDQAGLLVPAAVDNATGYRSYSPHQLPAAELLRDLRRLDLSIEQIREFQQADVAQRAALVSEQVTGFGQRLQDMQATARTLRTRIHSEGEAVPAMQVDAATLADAFGQVLPAVSNDRKLPELNTVLVEAREGSLRLVATDRHRLVVRDLLPDLPASGVFRAVVPAGAISDLGMTRRGAASLEHLGDRLVLRTDDGDHVLPVVQTPFPDYETVLSSVPDGRQLMALRSDVLAALEPILDAEYVELTLSHEGLVFDGSDGVTVPAHYEGEPIDLAIRPSYMHEAVVHSVGAEVVVEVTEPIRPVVFRSADDGSYTCMVMPVRIGPPSKKEIRSAPVR